MLLDKEKFVKLIQPYQLASPKSFKADSPRIFSKTPNTQSTLHFEYSQRDQKKQKYLAELSENRFLTTRYQVQSKTSKQKTNAQKIQLLCNNNENNLFEQTLKQSQFFRSTDSLLQNVNIVSPSSTFCEEFNKINQKLNQGKSFDDEKCNIQRKQSNSVIQISNRNFESISNATFYKPHQKIKEIDEISILDLKNLNTQLQSENLTLKSQIEAQQNNINHQNKIIAKLKQNILFLEQFNNQLKLKNEKQISIINILNNKISDEGNSKQQLINQIESKELQLSQYNQIEETIKNIEDDHLKMLNSLKEDFINQQANLKLLNNHLVCLSQIAILLSENEDIPIEILFKYKSLQQQQLQKVDSDLIQINSQNQQLIKDILESISKTFDKLSHNFVHEFSKKINK